MSTSVLRTARIEHECEFCVSKIGPGERYVEATAPPNHEDIGNLTWMRVRRHLRRECYPYGTREIPADVLPLMTEETTR